MTDQELTERQRIQLAGRRVAARALEICEELGVPEERLAEVMGKASASMHGKEPVLGQRTWILLPAGRKSDAAITQSLDEATT